MKCEPVVAVMPEVLGSGFSTKAQAGGQIDFLLPTHRLSDHFPQPYTARGPFQERIHSLLDSGP